ncbi:MAG: leucine-rich repeat domain-containing protein [Bacteroidetes bacterium]|nr:leucine-rich repeat domain-containing protein [Bacteroidota bacterium]
MTVLPNEIGKLTNLKELYISFNGLNSLPASISGLKKLSYLQCDGNNLKMIPKEIGSLTNLNKLSFMRNQIRSFDDNITNCKALTELILDENYLVKQQIDKLKDLLPNCAIYTEMQK